MTEKDKKMKAAITGVLYYLQKEKERQAQPVRSDPGNQPSNWAAYSRQMTMINRDRYQRRTIKR